MSRTTGKQMNVTLTPQAHLTARTDTRNRKTIRSKSRFLVALNGRAHTGAKPPVVSRDVQGVNIKRARPGTHLELEAIGEQTFGHAFDVFRRRAFWCACVDLEILVID